MIRTAILVTGTRVTNDLLSRAVTDALSPFNVRERRVVLLHGNAPHGADAAADHIARRWHWRVWPLDYFEDLDYDGGPLRNSALASVLQSLGMHGFQLHAFAFPDKESTGTWDCVRAVQLIGVEPKIIHVGARGRRAG